MCDLMRLYGWDIGNIFIYRTRDQPFCSWNWWRDAFVCVPWRIHVWDAGTPSTGNERAVEHSKLVPWPRHVCAMPHTCVCHDSQVQYGGAVVREHNPNSLVRAHTHTYTHTRTHTQARYGGAVVLKYNPDLRVWTCKYTHTHTHTGATWWGYGVEKWFEFARTHTHMYIHTGATWWGWGGCGVGI